jgi:heme exporter protein A
MLETAMRPMEPVAPPISHDAVGREGAPAAPGELIAVRDLSCVRDDRVLFQDLSFSLGCGEVLQVEGRNGSGKTSLLRILCGLALPTSGEVLWRGEAINRVRAEFLADLTYVGHAHGVKVELTPVENLRIARALQRQRAGVSPEQALQRVGLLGFEDVAARALSAGQCRRVALGRLLVTQTRLWLLDEPFTAIDRRGMRDVEAILEQHVANGGTVVLTTHHPIRMGDCKVSLLDLTDTGPRT